MPHKGDLPRHTVRSREDGRFVYTLSIVVPIIGSAVMAWQFVSRISDPPKPVASVASPAVAPRAEVPRADVARAEVPRAAVEKKVEASVIPTPPVAAPAPAPAPRTGEYRYGEGRGKVSSQRSRIRISGIGAADHLFKSADRCACADEGSRRAAQGGLTASGAGAAASVDCSGGKAAKHGSERFVRRRTRGFACRPQLGLCRAPQQARCRPRRACNRARASLRVDRRSRREARSETHGLRTHQGSGDGRLIG